MRSSCAKSRGEKKKVGGNLCEKLRESSRLRNFVRGVNAKKELFSWADLYILPSTYVANKSFIITVSQHMISKIPQA